MTGTALTNLNSHTVNWSTFSGGFDVANAANVFTVSQALSGTGALNKLGVGKLVLSGTSSLSGAVTVSAGTLVLNGANNFSGGITVNAAGTLALGNANALGATGLTDNGALDLGGYSPTFASLTGTGSVGNNSGAGISTLTLSGTSSATSAVLLKDTLGTAGGTSALTVGNGWYYSASGPDILGNMALGQNLGAWLFSGSNSFTGATTVNAGSVRLSGTGGRFASTGSVMVTGNGTLIDGDATAATNNGISNRINSSATLALGGSSGGGTFTLAAAAASNTHSQTLASLTVGAGQNSLNASAATGTNTLIFSGAAGSVYTRNANGLVDFTVSSGLLPSFTNAPTGAGVSGAGANAILIGATRNGADFVASGTGTVVAAAYTASGATSLTAGANISLTGANTTLPGSTTLSINSLLFPDNAARTLNLGAGSALTIASGGIITGTAVATAGSTITSGSLTSAVGDLWIYANGSGFANSRNTNSSLTVASQIFGNISVTVGGGQQVTLSNTANSYTGGLFLTGGKVVVPGDGALGSTTGTVTAVSGVNSLNPTAGFTFNSSRNFVINAGATLNIGDLGQTDTIAGQVSGGGELAVGYVSNGQRLILTNTNSGFTGRYDVNGFTQASQGVGLSSNANLMFNGRGSFGLGLLETSGTFSRVLGSGAGQVMWLNDSQYGSGGFSAVGGPLTVNIDGNPTPDTLTWGSTYFIPASGQYLVLESPVATNDVTFLNNIALNGATRVIQVAASGTTKAILSGVISGNASSGLTLNGASASVGTLQLTGSNTYAGKTAISSCTLKVASINSVVSGSASSNLGAPTTVANGTIDFGATTNAATLLYTGPGETTDRVVNLAGTTGGATIDQSGTGLLKFSSNLTITGNGVKTLSLQGSTAGNGEFAGNIVDGAAATSLTKAGTGTWTLSGSNSYSGSTTISSGTLALASAGALSGTGNIGFGGGTLQFSGSNQADISGRIASSGSAISIDTNGQAVSFTSNLAVSNTGGLTKLGLGSLTLTGSDAYTGATTVTSGTLQIGNGASGSIPSSNVITVNGGGTLALNLVGSGTFGNYITTTVGIGSAVVSMLGSGTTTFSSNITGPGGFNQNGSGTTIFSGNESYAGPTNITAGALVINSAGAANNSTVIVGVNNGLAFGVNAATIGGLSGSGNIALLNGTNAVTLTVGGNNLDSTYSGVLSGSNGAFYKTGTGTWTLSGNNTCTGFSTVHSGAVVFTGSSTLGSTGFTIGDAASVLATVTLSGSAALTLPGSTASVYTLAVAGVGNGRGVLNIKDNAQLILPSATGTGTTFGYQLSVGTGGVGAAGAVYQSGGSVTIDQVLGVGSASGSGYYGLSGGSLTVTGSAGNNSTRFRIGSPNPGNSGLLAVTGGTINLSGVIGLGIGIVDAAGGAVGALDANPGFGSIYLTGGSLIATPSYLDIGNRGGQGDLTISGSGAVTVGGNVTNLGSTSSNAVGVLNLNGGLLQTGEVNKGYGGGSSYLNFNGGTLKAGGANGNFLTGLTRVTINGAYSSGGISYAGGGTIDTNGQNNTIGQNLLAPTGNGVATSGSFTPITGLLGAPYIQVTGGGGTGATAQAIFDPSLGTVTGITVTNPGTDYTSAPTFQLFGGGISGTTAVSGTTFANTSGGLAKSGSGTLTLSGSNNYTGLTTISAGTLALASVGALAGGGNITFNGGTLQFSGSNTGDYSANIVNSPGVISLDTNGQSVVFASSLASSNIGGLTKIGSGTLTLGGSNAFTGDTSVNGGTLALGDPSALSASTLNYNNLGGSLSFGTQTAATFGGLKGAQNLALSNISGQAVALTIGGNNQSTTYSGALSGSGSLTKTGTGTLTLAVANSHSGDTTVNGGTLALGNASSLVASTLNLTGGALSFGALTGATIGGLKGAGNLALSNTAGAAVTLTTGGNNQNTTYSGALSGSSGTVYKTGTGTWTLSGNNTYSGWTTVHSGAVTFTGSNSLGNVGMTIGDAASVLTTVTLSGSGVLTLPGNTAAANSLNVTSVSSALAVLNIRDSAQLDLPTASGTGLTFGMQLGVGNGGAGASGALFQTGGSVNIDQALYVGIAGAGYYSLTGGSLTVTGSTGNSATRFRVGGPTAGSYGLIAIAGGTANVSGIVGYGIGIVD